MSELDEVIAGLTEAHKANGNLMISLPGGASILNVLQLIDWLKQVPQEMDEDKVQEITYQDCADAMLKMWIDDVLTDGEYNRIMDKLNAYQAMRYNIHNPEILDRCIWELDLSAHAYNCLTRAGIDVVGELISKTEEDIKKIRNLGKKTYAEISEKLAGLGLHFKEKNNEHMDKTRRAPSGER